MASRGSSCGSCSGGSDAEDCEAEVQAPPPRQGLGQANTGPKGVIADYKDYQRQREAHRAAQATALWKEAERLTLRSTDKPAGQSGEDEDSEVDRDRGAEENSDLDLSDDEDFMREYRQRRLNEMAAVTQTRLPRFGAVSEVTPDTYVDFIDAEGPHTPVILHLYSKAVPACHTMSAALRTLAKKHPTAKFGEVVAASLSGKFAGSDGLPALLVYVAGELEHNLVGITGDIGESFDAGELEHFLARRGILVN